MTNTKPKKKKLAGAADWSGGTGLIPGRDVLGPLFLMLTTPCFSIIFFHVCANMNGDFVSFLLLAKQQGWRETLMEIWPNPWDAYVWKMIGSFLTFELLLMKIVPGQKFEATLTPKGNRPIYKANGMACYLLTLATLLILASTGLFDPGTVYDNFGKILASMNILAWFFCTVLLIKGYMWPSSSDSGSTGSLLQDFYWGMELYPRICGWDVKQFTNCRAGMMFWAVSIVCFAYKNQQLHDQLQYGMAVSVALQLIYISKFYHWEMGYMCSMDIQHDRAGYYICWGCLVWVPAVYTSQAFYLTQHAPNNLDLTTALIMFLVGWWMIEMNYESDVQRYVFRQTAGKCRIWGQVPTKIVATYQTATGQSKQSLLLTAGYWKFSRHFHYVPEILASLCWSLPALDTGLVGPYFYVVYLTILLTDRAFRDDDRCRKKYGKYWEDYCQQVPYKIVPGII